MKEKVTDVIRSIQNYRDQKCQLYDTLKKGVESAHTLLVPVYRKLIDRTCDDIVFANRLLKAYCEACNIDTNNLKINDNGTTY